MKILVTGAGGFLGHKVVERLLAHGYTDVRCFVRHRRKIELLDRIRDAFPGANMEYMVGNLKTRADAEAATQGVDLVFHLAASMHGACADMFLDSVVASRNLLDGIAGRKSMRVVLVSSLSVLCVSDLGRGAVVNERTPLESQPERRDAYSYSKLRQEQLFWEYQKKYGFELVVLRPGVIYGPEGAHFSNRVGLNLFGVFLHIGGKNLLPLTYIDNCAEAIVTVGTHEKANGEAFNIHDDDLPSCRAYLIKYKKTVRKMRSVRVSYSVITAVSRLLEWYNHCSKGQLPRVFTPYKNASLWGGHRFDNTKLKALGWRQLVPTREGLHRAFQAFKKEMSQEY